MNKKIKRIGIDARFYGPTGKGLGRYTQEIVDNIIKLDTENEYVIFLNKENFDELITRSRRIKKVMADVRWYTILEQIKMPYLIFKENLDLIHFPHFNIPYFCPIKFIVTIHDLILFHYPTPRATTLSPLLYKLKNFFYNLIIKKAIKSSKKIITVSNFTKQDILKHFKINPDKIEVTYEGVANLARGNDSLFAIKLNEKEVLIDYNLKSPFILYVGNAYPHKNLERLICVFEKLIKKQPNLKLVLVGKEDYFYKRIKNFALEKKLWNNNENSPIIFTGYVPDTKLEILFNQAFFYIFPSLYEGFGLPPLEAMSKNCPVLSSNKSCLPEILGEAALYFDPEDEIDILEKMEKIIKDENLRKRLIELGKKQCKKYEWWDCARRTLDVYQKILLK